MMKKKITVLEIKADFDPYGHEYVQVNLGYEIPVVTPPQVEKMYPPPPKPKMYKHALHVIIPKEKWNDQYHMWEEYTLIIKDNGELELKK